MQKFRVAAFNVQNLFSRPRLFAAGDDLHAANALKAAANLQRLLDQKVYRPDEIIRTFNEAGLCNYLSVQCDRVIAEGAQSQRFFFHQNEGDACSPVVSINHAIHGRGDWVGGIALQDETLSGPQVLALARVMKKVDADVIGLCEVEDRRTLETFNARHLGGKYPYCVLIEGNDTRGIDVALMSKHPVGALHSNAWTLDEGEPARRGGVRPRLFNRDCLEVTIALPGYQGDLAVLVAHLKSKRGSDDGERETDAKRLRQSAEIARIVRARYTKDGTPHRMIVCGDLNEVPHRDGANGAMLGGAMTSIDPILTGLGLHNIIEETLKPEHAFTQVDERGGQVLKGQIDYLLLSQDVRHAAIAAGIDRSGQALWGPKAPPRAMAASDHACIFVDLDLDRLG